MQLPTEIEQAHSLIADLQAELDHLRSQRAVEIERGCNIISRLEQRNSELEQESWKTQKEVDHLRSQATRYAHALHDLRQQIKFPPGDTSTQLERLFVAVPPGVVAKAANPHPAKIAQQAMSIAIASLRELEHLETLTPAVYDAMTPNQTLIALESHLGQLRSVVYGLMSKQAMLDCLTAIERTTQQAIASLQNDHSTD